MSQEAFWKTFISHVLDVSGWSFPSKKKKKFPQGGHSLHTSQAEATQYVGSGLETKPRPLTPHRTVEAPRSPPESVMLQGTVPRPRGGKWHFSLASV